MISFYLLIDVGIFKIQSPWLGLHVCIIKTHDIGIETSNRFCNHRVKLMSCISGYTCPNNDNTAVLVNRGMILCHITRALGGLTKSLSPKIGATFP
jgi:hypothetical protein